MPFEKGKSGNPGGRPKVVADVRKLAGAHTAWVILRLRELAASEDGRVAVAACKELLDRGCGKAPQPITGDTDGGPLKFSLSFVGIPEEREVKDDE